MALKASWVEHLFGRLTLRYGSAFLRQWPDADPALVKADWAEVLDGTSGDALGYALRYLPAAPINALRFRDLCRMAPAPESPRLPAPDIPRDPERVARILAPLRSAAAGRDGTPAEQCAANILRIAAERGGRLSPPQRAQLRAMGFDETGARRMAHATAGEA